MHGHFDGRYGVQLRFEREAEFEKFLDRHTFSELRFITGCGFESRTTVMMTWIANHASFKVECLGVDLLNKHDPSYPKARRLQQKNMSEMQDIAQKKRWRFTLVKSDLYSARSIAHRPVLDALKSMLANFSGDYLVDISSLPRSIALPVLKILWNSVRARNLLAVYTEDTRVGALGDRQ